MTRHFMRDTPLYQMEQMMMTPPHFKSRGHGLRRSGFRYQAKDVDCEYCMNYSRRNLCPLDQCICLEERIETGALSLEELLRDCLNSKPKMSLWRRLAQLLYQQSLQFFRTDEHRRRWMHWRTRYPQNLLHNLLVQAYNGKEVGRPKGLRPRHRDHLQRCVGVYQIPQIRTSKSRLMEQHIVVRNRHCQSKERFRIQYGTEYQKILQ